MPFEIDQAPRQSFAAREIMDAAPRISDALDAGITVTIRPVSWLGMAGRVDGADSAVVPELAEDTKRAIMQAYNNEAL